MTWQLSVITFIRYLAFCCLKIPFLAFCRLKIPFTLCMWIWRKAFNQVPLNTEIFFYSIRWCPVLYALIEPIRWAAFWRTVNAIHYNFAYKWQSTGTTNWMVDFAANWLFIGIKKLFLPSMVAPCSQLHHPLSWTELDCSISNFSFGSPTSKGQWYWSDQALVLQLQLTLQLTIQKL